MKRSVVYTTAVADSRRGPYNQARLARAQVGPELSAGNILYLKWRCLATII